MLTVKGNVADQNFLGGIVFGVALGIAAVAVFSAATEKPAASNRLLDYQTLWVGVIAFFVSLGVAWQTHRTTQNQYRVAAIQAQSAIFAERMLVFQTVKDFLRPWFVKAYPDLRELPKLVDAWERSKFLFDESVTGFLRQLWLDAVKADYDRQIIAGEIPGDHHEAVVSQHSLTIKYLGGEPDRPDILEKAFKSMKIAHID